jgi:hydrocephalus-inducing protein
VLKKGRSRKIDDSSVAASNVSLFSNNDKLERMEKDSMLSEPKGTKVKLNETLTLGNFFISPASGSVPKGGTLKVNVDFSALASNSTERMGVDVFDRDPNDHPQEYPFDLLGEMCIPGIEVDDFPSIFEEQVVTKTIPTSTINRSIYATQDRVLVFRTIILGNIVEEKIKIINSSKVTCQCSVSVSPRNISGKALSSDTNTAAAFEVEPKMLNIPSNESQYVTVTFKPQMMTTYSAIFECKVDAKGERETKERQQLLSFELRGEATLPQLSIEKPERNLKTGQPTLRFHTLLLGCSESQKIVLFNDGVLPCVFSIDSVPQREFIIEEIGKQFILEPKFRKTFEVTFRPTESKKYTQDLFPDSYSHLRAHETSLHGV